MELISSFLEIRPYNAVFFGMLAFIPIFAVASYYIFKDKSQKVKDLYIWGLLIFLAVTWLVGFTVSQITDPEQRYYVLTRLPLSMCSSNIITYAVIFAFRNKNTERIEGEVSGFFNKVKQIYKNNIRTAMFAYMFFFGSPGALMGLLMPPSDTVNASIFHYNSFFYFMRHILIFLIPIILIVLGYYKPKAKDILGGFIFFFALVTIAHCVNYILTFIGGSRYDENHKINYFYTRGDSNIVLNFFWNLVPIEYIYLFPVGILILPIYCIYYSPFFVMNYLKKRKANKALE